VSDILDELDEQFKFSITDYQNWDIDKLADAFKTAKVRSERTLSAEPRRDQYKIVCSLFKTELDKRRKE
jgi:hypothetical protein